MKLKSTDDRRSSMLMTRKFPLTLVLAALAVGLMILGGEQGASAATLCVKPVISPSCFDSIQDAVNFASPGDTIRVRAGVYKEQVVIGTSRIRLKGDPGAILDGATLSPGDGITIQSGVSRVTIEGFEIRNYTGTSSGVGNGIQSWNCGTDDIKVIGNNIHDNAWNAILVGNEGEGLHRKWLIKDNVVTNNGFYNIEITNGEDSVIQDNKVTGPGGSTQAIGILLQARNFDVDYLSCLEHPDSIVSSGNRISGNTVSGFAEGSFGGGEGIRLLAFAGLPKSATLTNTKAVNNQVFDNDRQGILIFNFNAGGFGTGVVDDSVVDKNVVVNNGREGIRLIDGDNSVISKNTVISNDRHGIRLGEGGAGGSTGNKVSKNKVLANGDGVTYFDLFHDVASTPNSWKNNTCGTKSGADIPPC